MCHQAPIVTTDNTVAKLNERRVQRRCVFHFLSRDTPTDHRLIDLSVAAERVDKGGVRALRLAQSQHPTSLVQTILRLNKAVWNGWLEDGTGTGEIRGKIAHASIPVRSSRRIVKVVFPESAFLGLDTGYSLLRRVDDSQCLQGCSQEELATQYVITVLQFHCKVAVRDQLGCVADERHPRCLFVDTKADLHVIVVKLRIVTRKEIRTEYNGTVLGTRVRGDETCEIRGQILLSHCVAHWRDPECILVNDNLDVIHLVYHLRTGLGRPAEFIIRGTVETDVYESLVENSPRC